MQKFNIILVITLTIYSNSVAKTSENNKLDKKNIIWKCTALNQVIKQTEFMEPIYTDSDIILPNVSIYSSKMVPTSTNLTKYFHISGNKFNNIPNNTISLNFEEQGFNQYLMDDGNLYLEGPNQYNRWLLVNKSDFCYDFTIDGTVLTPIFITFMPLTSEKEPNQVLTDFTTAVMFLSCLFLFLVLIIYQIIEETRNLIGLTIMAYVFCFLNGLLVLAVTRCISATRLMCKVSTYYVYFFLLASFCWMNIISYDIWSMSRRYTQNHTRTRRRKWVQFMRYAAYAFGVPTALTILMFVLDNVNLRSVPWFVTPGLDVAPCFFDGGPRFLYLYIPVLVLIFCNTVFYVMTGCSLRRHYKETSMLTRSGDRGVTRRQRQRLWMFVKLSVVMGVNWVFEVISAVTPEWSGWYVTDIYNLLIGVAMFVIFVCKKKTFTKLRIKLGCMTAYEIQGRQNRKDSYTTSSHEGSMHLSPNAEGQSKSFHTISLS